MDTQVESNFMCVWLIGASQRLSWRIKISGEPFISGDMSFMKFLEIQHVYTIVDCTVQRIGVC